MIEIQSKISQQPFTTFNKWPVVHAPPVLTMISKEFLSATAGTAIARLSHRNSVCLSVTRVDQAKTVQARIIKSSPLAAPQTLVSGSV